MKTNTCISSAPVMPAVWPQGEHIRQIKRRLPNTVDEPKNIGYYLESLRDISSNPDRENVLKEFFKETYVTIKFFNYVFSINLSDDYSRYGSEYQSP